MSKEKDKFGFTEKMKVVFMPELKVEIPDSIEELKYSKQEYSSTHKRTLEENSLGKTLKIDKVKYNDNYDRYFIQWRNKYVNSSIIAMDIYNLLFDKPIKMKDLQKKSKPKLSNKDLLRL